MDSSSVGLQAQATPGGRTPVRAGRVGARGGVPGPRQGPGETTALQPRGKTTTSARGCGDVALQPRLWQRSRQLSLANGGKTASAGPRDGWKAAGGCRPLSHSPCSPWTRPARGSRSAPPSWASQARSPGSWRGPRVRRGRAGPLPLPARSPPPRVPSGAPGTAGSVLRSPELPRLRGWARRGQGQQNGR